jgi:hypothetical protein
MTAHHTLPTRPHTSGTTPRTGRLTRMRHTAAELTPHAIEQIAQRVAQLLHEHQAHGSVATEPVPARLLDATQLARHLGVTRTWVYEHAHQLGAIRLGTGSKARLRFDLDTATAAITNRQKRTPEDNAPSVETPRRGRPRRRPQPTVPLLPVHEPRVRGIRARLARIGRGR